MADDPIQNVSIPRSELPTCHIIFPRYPGFQNNKMCSDIFDSLCKSIIVYRLKECVKNNKRYLVILILCSQHIIIKSDNIIIEYLYIIIIIKNNPYFPWSRYQAWMAGPMSLSFFLSCLVLLGEGSYKRKKILFFFFLLIIPTRIIYS